MLNNNKFINIYSSDFLTGIQDYNVNPDGWSKEVIEGEYGVVDAPILEDKKAFKSMLNYSTDYSGLGAGRPRNQLACQGFLLYPNNTYITSVKIYLPEYLQIETYTNDMALLGFHQRYSLDTPLGNQNNASPCSIGLSGSQYYFKHCHSSEYPPIAGETKDIIFGDVVADLGKWVQWDFIYKSRQNSKGKLQIYKDGKRIITFTGQTAYSSPISEWNYFKVGLYKWGWQVSPTSTDYHEAYYTDILIKKYEN